MTQAPTSGGRAMRGVLIGAGFLARSHVRAWRDLGPEGARTADVCDLDPARAQATVAEFGAEAFVNPGVMLQAIRPDVVDAATTTPSHRALVEPCASGACVWTLAPCLAACASAEQGRRVPP